MRARQTAEAIAGSRPYVADPRWREFAFGEWEGLRVSDIDPGTNARAYAPPGGETFELVYARVRDALTDLRATAAHRALVVTHAGPLHAMLSVLFPEPVPVRFEPASITCVRLDAQAQLLSLGITVRQYANERHGPPG
jgi:broad specificity phosphatase PhoE